MKTKTIVITGSSSGFGKLIVETLSKEGHTVFATMRDVKGKNVQSANDLSSLKNVHVIELDVTKDQSVTSAFSSILGMVDDIDVVINNAGIIANGITEGFSIEDTQRIFDVNVYGVLRVSKAILPHFRKKGDGLIIHISSSASPLSVPFMGIYNGSKAALDKIAESLKYDLSPLGVDSVIVHPGGYPTELLNNRLEGSDAAEVNDDYGTTLGYMGQLFGAFSEAFSGDQAPNPQDIADTVKNLINTEKGQRPLRTVMDRFTQEIVEDINQTIEKNTNAMIGNFGLSDILKVKG